MAYTGIFSNRVTDNLVRILEVQSVSTDESGASANVGAPVTDLISGVTTTGAIGSANTAKPDYIILDATTTFSKTFRAKVSDNPVADNTQRADNYRVYTPTIKISGVISNDAIDLYAWAESLGTARAQKFVERLENIFKNKTLVDILIPDGLDTRNCMIESLVISRDKKWSNGFYVEISAKEVELVKDIIVALPDLSIRNKVAAKKSAGTITGDAVKLLDTKIIPKYSA